MKTLVLSILVLFSQFTFAYDAQKCEQANKDFLENHLIYNEIILAIGNESNETRISSLRTELEENTALGLVIAQEITKHCTKPK